MTRVQLYYDGIGEVMRSAKVRNALQAHATRITASARALSSTEGVVSSIGVENGTRPKGRPYGRVNSDAVNAEFGSSNTKRRRLLARAAGI